MARHLTRQQARALPSFIEDPEFNPRRGFHLAEGCVFPIYRDGKPVTHFVPGWRPSGLSVLFYPIVILEFQHENNASAYWILDNSLTYLGSKLEQLSPTDRIEVERRATSIATFLENAGEPCIPFRLPDDVRSFLRLSPQTRDDILDCFGLANNKAQHQAAEQAFTFAVETDIDGIHRFADADRKYELLAHGEPVVLLPGWHIRAVSSLLFPVLTADLQHEDGHAAYWFFDCRGNYIIDRWDRLPEHHRAMVAAYGSTILEDLWQDLVASPGDRTRDHVEEFLALPIVTRSAIFDMQHSPLRPDHQTTTWSLTEPSNATAGHISQTELGPLLLKRRHVEQLLQRNLQSQNLALVNDGSTRWPSPLDGRELASSGAALLLDSHCFAYRVQDPEVGLTFYMIALGGHFRTFAVYLPGNDLLIARDAQHLEGALRYQTRYRLLLLKHALQHGKAMLTGARKPAGEIYHTFRGHPAILIGHFIWQDLSGVQTLIAGTKAHRIPRFLVPESHLQPEMFGPIDTIFPALEGKVIRTDDTFDALVPGLYEANARLIKATGMHVPRVIGTSVLAGYKALPKHRKLVTRCHKVRTECDMLILIGLRIGNRTIIDITSFGMGIITAIAQAFPKAALILDGQNACGKHVYDCFGDNKTAPDSFLRQELEIAATLSNHALSEGVTLINNIGRPIADSLLWSDAADFFVAPWGAALAKYRWICNKPGLVLTGRWNLQHRSDLAIYHGSQYNEDPAGMWFNDLAAVEDVVDPNETDVTVLERSNFKVNIEAVSAQLVALLSDHVTPRKRTSDAGAASSLHTRRIAEASQYPVL